MSDDVQCRVAGTIGPDNDGLRVYTEWFDAHREHAFVVGVMAGLETAHGWRECDIEERETE